MNHPLRIVIADDEPQMLEYYKYALGQLGHQVVAAVGTGRELVEQCKTLKPDLVITDIRMPDMDGIEASNAMAEVMPIPVVLVSAYHDGDLIERAERDHILAYLVKPIQQAHLEPAIALAVARFAQFQALRKEATDLRQALEDRKVIERAKGILMQRASLTEHDAFRRLQKLARDQNRKLVDIAHMIVTAAQAFEAGNP